MDFGRECGCGRPYLPPPPTSARMQSRYEFLELALNMSFYCTRSHWDYRLIVWYNPVVPEVGECRVSTGVPGLHLCSLRTCITYLRIFTYEYEYVNVVVFTRYYEVQNV